MSTARQPSLLELGWERFESLIGSLATAQQFSNPPFKERRHRTRHRGATIKR